MRSSDFAVFVERSYNSVARRRDVAGPGLWDGEYHPTPFAGSAIVDED